MRFERRPTWWSLPRRFVAAVAAVLAATVWTHGLAGVLRHLGPADAPPAAWPLTLAAAVTLLALLALPRRAAEPLALILGVAALAVLELLWPGSWAAALALPIVAPAAVYAGRWLGGRLPRAVDHALGRRRAAALAWAFLALVAVVQVGRLSTYATDRQVGFFLTTEHPFWYGHECLSAYLYGAELAARGEENLYAAEHWPALHPEAAPVSEVSGMAVEDPYMYPPQFLLLPGLALAAAPDVATVRVVWLALQVTLFFVVAAALALWVGGRPGRLALWLTPLVAASFPALHNFQFGQFHLPAVALAVVAMLAFDRRRPALGGGLLAVAILAKVFPAVLLPLLAAQRRLRELAWTAAWGVALTALTYGVFGPAPFTAFFEYQLPRLGGGAAFAFDEAWPALAELIVIDNQGVFGLAMKAGLGKGAAAQAGRLFGLLVLGTAAWAGWRAAGASKLWRGSSWLALLGLASLASPGAWGDYVPVVGVWLLTLVAEPMARRRRTTVALWGIGAFQVFLLGTMPFGSWAPTHLMRPVAAVGSLLLIALYAGALATRSRPAAAASQDLDDTQDLRVRRVA